MKKKSRSQVHVMRTDNLDFNETFDVFICGRFIVGNFNTVLQVHVRTVTNGFLRLRICVTAVSRRVFSREMNMHNVTCCIMYKAIM